MDWAAFLHFLALLGSLFLHFGNISGRDLIPHSLACWRDINIWDPKLKMSQIRTISLPAFCKSDQQVFNEHHHFWGNLIKAHLVTTNIVANRWQNFMIDQSCQLPEKIYWRMYCSAVSCWGLSVGALVKGQVLSNLYISYVPRQCRGR